MVCLTSNEKEGLGLLRWVDGPKSFGQPNSLWIIGLCWVAVILAAGVLPVKNFVGHSHWNSIVWYPSSDLLNSPQLVLRILEDVVANILLFVPLGWIWVQHFSLKGRCPCLSTILIGFFLSLGIELYQVFCHSRFPSLLDLVANTGGTYWGARFGSSYRYMTDR